MKAARAAALVVVSLVAASPHAAAQDSISAVSSSQFTTEHIEEIVGPIALYPDSLLTQILMASTYPLEVVKAARWLKDLKGISGDPLNTALQGHDWDISVKSLCNFPDILQRMSDNLDWTQDMGNAFLGQKEAVLDAVQRLRGKAKAAGNLATTPQQTVTETESGIFAIQPTDPSTVYVPAYYPSAVYGLMYPVPLYPALYRPWPSTMPVYGYGGAVAAGSCLYGTCKWGWGHSEVNVNVNTYNNYNRYTNVNATTIAAASGANVAAWNHDPAHRGGVNYANAAVAAQYRGNNASGSVAQSQARGYGATPYQAPTTAQKAAAAAATPRQPAASQPGGGDGGNAFSGMGNAGFEQQASNRGAQSWGGGGRGGRR